MSDKPISPLRQRMIDDMTARRVKEKVQKDYVRHVRTFAAFLGRSPDTATSEDLRRFQVHLARQEIGVATINAAIAALRFFFNVTLERPDPASVRPAVRPASASGDGRQICRSKRGGRRGDQRGAAVRLCLGGSAGSCARAPARADRLGGGGQHGHADQPSARGRRSGPRRPLTASV